MSRIGFVTDGCTGGSCKSVKGFTEKFINNQDVNINDYFDLPSLDKKTCYLSPQWSEFVMKQFQDNEQVEGFPKADGLRRVSELLLGDIIESKPTEVFPVHGNGEGRASVSYSVTFLWHDKSERTYADVADAYEANINPDFLRYALATAATRAECRALRKALKLKKCSFEELDNLDKNVPVERSTTSVISKPQMTLLRKKCKELDIDIMKFINSGEETYEVIEHLDKEAAKAFIVKLTELQKNPDTINSNWRN